MGAIRACVNPNVHQGSLRALFLSELLHGAACSLSRLCKGSAKVFYEGPIRGSVQVP